MQIKPDEKVQVIQYEYRIELILVRSIKQSRGILKGTNTTVTSDTEISQVR